MGYAADSAVAYFYKNVLNRPRRKDKRRRRVLKCPVCGKHPLRFKEFPDGWHLSEFDESNRETRHVCKMKRFGRLTR